MRACIQPFVALAALVTVCGTAVAGSHKTLAKRCRVVSANLSVDQLTWSGTGCPGPDSVSVEAGRDELRIALPDLGMSSSSSGGGGGGGGGGRSARPDENGEDDADTKKPSESCTVQMRLSPHGCYLWYPGHDVVGVRYGIDFLAWEVEGEKENGMLDERGTTRRHGDLRVDSAFAGAWPGSIIEEADYEYVNWDEMEAITTWSAELQGGGSGGGGEYSVQGSGNMTMATGSDGEVAYSNCYPNGSRYLKLDIALDSVARGAGDDDAGSDSFSNGLNLRVGVQYPYCRSNGD